MDAESEPGTDSEPEGCDREPEEVVDLIASLGSFTVLIWRVIST